MHSIIIQIDASEIKYAMQSVREVVNGISANFTHSMDAAHLAMTVNVCEFPMCTVHDSFGCHAGNVDTMRDALREQLASLYSTDILAFFRDRCLNLLANGVEDKEECDKLSKKIVRAYAAMPYGSLDVSEVLHSEYVFG